MITIKSDKPYGGELNIDMWYGDEFVPNKYGADAYDYNGRLSGNIYNESGKAIGDYTATDSALVKENFLTDFDISDVENYWLYDASEEEVYQALSDYCMSVEEYESYIARPMSELRQMLADMGYNPDFDITACDTIESATNSEDGTDLIHFYYNGQKLGDAPADDIQCPALLDLIREDKEAATQVLNYLNSLGDPVYPISDEDWKTPETEVDNIDKADLYYTFLQELGYEYDEVNFEIEDELYTQFGKFEIFTGEEVIESSTKITSAIKNMHGKVNENDYRTGYLYLLKHGIGPGTLPKDVTILKSMDLPHGFTAVWLDSVLTADELKKYDIPSETQHTRRLADIGYEANNQRELVPIENSTVIKCSTNYDTKIIAKYLKTIFDDEAFGTSHASSWSRISNGGPNTPEVYMARNNLFYNRRNRTIEMRDRKTGEDIPLYKVIPQYSSTKKNGTYAPKLPKIVPIESTAPIQSSTGITASTGWENYGDADPIEYGRLVKSNGDGTYEMLYIEPYPEDENLYLAAWLYFDMWDVTDGWISDHIDRVLQSTSGVSADEFDVLDNPIETFVDCVSYFGPQEFSPEYIGQTSQFATREEVEEALASIGF